MSGADGTRSILDMLSVSELPDYCAVAPLSREVLINLYGTDRPTHEMISADQGSSEDTERGQGFSMERGQGFYIVVHDGSVPTEIFFAGCSFD